MKMEKLLLQKKSQETVYKEKYSPMIKNGDQHYDVISAFQKSIRGSDVDAALHYMARLIEAGELVTFN